MQYDMKGQHLTICEVTNTWRCCLLCESCIVGLYFTHVEFSQASSNLQEVFHSFFDQSWTLTDLELRQERSWSRA